MNEHRLEMQIGVMVDMVRRNGWTRIVTGIVMALALAAVAPAQSTGPAAATKPAASRPAGATRTTDAPAVIVVIGAEGEEEFGEVFELSAQQWADAGAKGHAQTTIIGRKGASTAGGTEKEQLKLAIDAQATGGTGPLWLVFLGHGTYDGREAKINLRGPDVSQIEMFEWLKPFTRPLAVVDCTSASAPFLTKLSVKGANRVIVTATRSGSEFNYARFGMFMAQSIADPKADLDKDGQTSLLEAFLAASHRTTEFYKTESRLATEHALLDDNGDALGTPADFFEGTRATKPARNGAAVDGARASTWVLVPTAEELALTPAQRTERAALERQIETLRGQKSTLGDAAYYARLDGLMVQLAKVYAGKGEEAASQPAKR